MVQANPTYAIGPVVAKSTAKFKAFIPSLPSQDMLRLILEYAIGPNDKHVLY